MSERVLIAALSENRAIGRDGQLPWRLPEDLKRFKRLTIGKTVLMGRKTWDSLGRPLPERENWVLTRDAAFAAAGARVFAGLGAALAASAGRELVIIGGAELYRQTLPIATRLELTQVHAVVDGDAFFPALDPAAWRESAREDHAADERHALAYSFVTLLRN
ncbi:MAG: dihydrofolate reductase [Nevskia sp.]